MSPVENRVGLSLTMTPDTEPSLKLAVQLIPPLTGARRASLLLRLERARLLLAAAEGAQLQIGQPLPLTPGIAAEVLQTGRALLVEDLAEAGFPVHPERGYTSRSCMAVPIAWEDNLYGLICAADPTQAVAFTTDDLAALQLLAEQVGATIHTMLSLRSLIDIDPLTGVHSVRAFERQLSAEIERARRFGHPVSLAVLDIADLKRLNERDGHWAGDKVLQGTANAIRSTVRRVDLVGRLGDNEFAVVMPETSAENSLVAARRVATVMRELPPLPGLPGRLAIRVNIGVATMPPALEAAELLRQAQQALHIAKKDRDSVRHIELGSDVPRGESHSCSCETCGKNFLVATALEQRSRRYCSRACTSAARRQEQQDRNLSILALREDGLTLREIAERFVISEERVRQICARR